MMAMINFAACNMYPMHMIGVTERVMIHTARNILAREAIATDCEWVFWADSDMTFPLDTIPKMMKYAEKLGAKMLTGEYYKRLGRMEPVAQVVVNGKRHCVYPHDNRPFKIDACGFGCVLTHRSVFEAVDYPYFKYETAGEEVSEDFHFCDKVRKKNIDIWLLPEISCGHIGIPPVVTKKDFVPGKLENISVQGS
jgi:GT2 family glycosyltransferase